jgi:hypothetical protein
LAASVSKRDAIEWGAGFGDDGEVRYYDGGIVVRHVGADEAAHHAPSHGLVAPFPAADRPRSAIRCPECEVPLSTSGRCLNTGCSRYNTWPLGREQSPRMRASEVTTGTEARAWLDRYAEVCHEVT